MTLAHSSTMFLFCWGTSVEMVSVLFLSSTGQPCACSVCSKDVEAKAEHLGKVSSHLSFYLVSLPVSVSFPITWLCYSFEVQNPNSLFEQNKGLLLNSFNISVRVGEKKKKASIHLLAVSTSSSHWRWQQTQSLPFKALKCHSYGVMFLNYKLICKYIAAEMLLGIKMLTFLCLLFLPLNIYIY